ncbi:MAG TPA: 50S ribosomal protein L22 [Candidatus Acidoferrales bacterium]|nr:50S ribosomal protein L22 [Candidatus Acidoferrales bacterium]
MEVKALAKSVRISPRKLRLVAYAVKNMPIDDAYRVLEVTHKRAARIVQKTLKSAVANAVTNAKLDSNNLLIASVTVNESQPFKRFRPSTRGRIHPYKKRGSHLTIILKEKVNPVQPETVKKAKDEKGGKKV